MLARFRGILQPETIEGLESPTGLVLDAFLLIPAGLVFDPFFLKID